VLVQWGSLNPAHLGNYRPVSLHLFVAKTLEQVVFNQISSFLTQNNLLDNNSLVSNSTETALVSLHYIILHLFI